ncbi:hypothetical protein Hanom_Chr10g00925011 [Helianthus anomalus]
MISQCEQDIQQRLTNPDIAPDFMRDPEEKEMRHSKWRVEYMRCIAKPQSPPRQVAYMLLEDDESKGNILSWIYVKDLRCVAIKREFRMQYFNSVMRILTLPHYDVSAMARIKMINRSDNPLLNLFERRVGWVKINA